LWVKINKQHAVAQFRERSTKIHGRGRFTNASFLISDRDNFHSGLHVFSGLRDLPDDVVAHSKRKLNFSDFRFGISAVAFKHLSL